MKIEMGESLAASWLKHVQRCLLVQTNWKASSRRPWQNLVEIDEILRELCDEFGDESIDIWGNVNAAQLVRQTECDVLGFDVINGEQRVVALEVATHLTGEGLRYTGTKHDNRNVTVNISDDKVPAKLFSNAMAIYASAGIRHGEFSFATPIANNELVQRINDRLGRIEHILNNRGFDFRLRLYANRRFYREILRPVVAIVDDVSNTNELFLRAMQLYLASSRRWTPFDNEEGDGGYVVPVENSNGENRVVHHRQRVKFDVLVNEEPYQTQLYMGDAAYYCVVAYCENTAGISFQDLRTAFPRTAHGTREVIEIEREGLDLSRFSDPIILDDGTRVLVTNQWCGNGAQENWQRFVDWAAGLDRPGLEIRIVPHQ